MSKKKKLKRELKALKIARDYLDRQICDLEVVIGVMKKGTRTTNFLMPGIDINDAIRYDLAPK